MLEQKIDQLIATIEALTEVLRSQQAAPVKAAKQKAAKLETPVEQVAAKLETPIEQVAAKLETPVEQAAPAVAKPTLQDLRDAGQKALDAGKLSDVIAINKELGVKRISEVPEEKWAEVIAKLKALHG